MKYPPSMEPFVSIVIPVLNSQRVLEACLKSIASQKYPKNKVEVIVVDGGSTDNTMEIARSYDAKIVNNPLKTGEAGKAVGVREAKGEFVALIDSDNVLPSDPWLAEMITPLMERATAVGSEPIAYTWRKSDGFIARYCALLGMNDPLVHFLGNYDRMNLLTGKWTEIAHEEKDYGNYLLVAFDARGVPTIGANGTVFRKSFLAEYATGDYLFDIDIIAKAIQKSGSVDFIKVKNGIVHTFCESSVSKFAKKQRRRVADYLYHKAVGDRSYRWEKRGFLGANLRGQLKFVVYCLTIVPLFLQAIGGFLKKRDFAWFFHPLACEITLFVYTLSYIFCRYSAHEVDRGSWKQ